MATLALVLFVLYLALAFGLRTLVQLRRTGSTGFRGLSGRPGSPEWLGGVLFVVALALHLAAPVLDLTGVLEPFTILDNSVAGTFGIVLFTLGAIGTLAAQGAMGASWRIGVDQTEKTGLVTAGPFAIVRNPIFSAMMLASFGMALMVPNLAGLAAFFCLVLAIELQVRFVEEPYLIHTHAERYTSYAARTGRFLPGLGRIRSQRSLRL